MARIGFQKTLRVPICFSCNNILTLQSTYRNINILHFVLFFRFLTFLFLPVYNFWLLLCPDKLSYDWQMGSLPLIHFSSIINDITYIVIPLFYGTILGFILVLVKRLRSQQEDYEEETCKNQESDHMMMIDVRNIFKFIRSLDFTSAAAWKNNKNVSC